MSKYIIEKDDNESIWSIYADKDGVTTIEGVSLTPYTEPDTNEAYQRGYEEGYAVGEAKKNSVEDEAYERGLNDAWTAARKIYDISHEDRLEIFPEASTFVVADICDRYSASEAIEKIRRYEYEQEQIQVGDEVKDGDERYIVLQKYLNNIDELMVVLFNSRNGEINKWHLYNADGVIFKKTGRHFPEIAAVLAKMKEES